MSELPRAQLLRSRLRRAAPWLIAAAAIALVVLGVRACSMATGLGPTVASEGDPPGTQAWHGSLALPRGGPYVIGFDSPGPARLELTGDAVPAGPRFVVTGRGVTTRRVLLVPSPNVAAVGVRFAAPPGARLLWLPPGRRGEPEYILNGALEPTPPAKAQEEFDHPDRSIADAAGATAIVVIVLALAAWLLRHRVRALPRAMVLGALAVLALALVVRLESLGAAGQTWDEDTYWSAGRNYIHNLLAGDFDQRAWVWNYQHPPVSKYLAGLGAWWSDGYGPARAVSAIVMALACMLLVPIGARLHRLSTGVAAGVVAALTPHLIAHGQIVGHEAPTALTWMIALWASLRAWDGIDPRETGSSANVDEAAIRRRLIARCAGLGVVLGVAMMVRFVNVLAAPAIGLTILVAAPRGRRVQAIGLGLAVIPAVAIVTSILIWPRLWSHPLTHLDEAWSRLKNVHSREPFLGAITNTPPRWYFLVYLGATAPLGVALAVVAGKLAWLRDRARWRSLAIVAIWAAAPLAVMFSPVRQDGVRYIIPSLAMLALLAGAGVIALGELLARRWPGRPHLHRVPAAVLVVYLLVVCVRIRPYYLDYYGEQVGGTATVARRHWFEVAWWGEGITAAIDYVNQHAAPGDRVHRSCVEPIHLTWFRGDLWEPVSDPRAARWLVHYQLSWRPCAVPPGAVRVFTASAGGAPLVDVYRIDPSAPSAPILPASPGSPSP